MNIPYPQQHAGHPAAPVQSVPQGYSTAPQGLTPGYVVE